MVSFASQSVSECKIKKRLGRFGPKVQENRTELISSLVENTSSGGMKWMNHFGVFVYVGEDEFDYLGFPIE